MKKSVISLFFICMFGFSSASSGHSDHVHPAKKPVTEEVARVNAGDSVAKLISEKKLEESWSKAELVKIEKRNFKGKDEWMVTFQNKAVTDTAKQNLYVFLKLSGEYVAANFSGK